ncbi:MAG: CpXC domain-containing protein [Ruminococcus sp.]|nr:CpXC domain-containing protein [Ruminococcus sp.]
MSNVISKEVACPKCNEVTNAHLYISINATNDPQFREDLLNESLLKWKCENCGYEGRFTYPLLYNDMKRRFMVYLIPGIDRFQLEDRSLEEDYRNLKGITKRITPDFNAFKEKIFIFESGLDDMAVELTKLAISETVAKKYGLEKVEEGYLSMYNRETNTMGFTFFVTDNHEPYVQTARLEVYARSAQIVSEVGMNDKKLSGFIKIDREWAENTLFRYKRKGKGKESHT